MPISRIIPAYPEHSEFAQAVGEALHQWSMVELELATLFERVSGIPNRDAAQAAMAAIVSFNARVQVCQAVLAFWELSEDERSAWSALVKRMTNMLKKRNALAHFTILAMETEDGKQIWQLFPYFSLGQLATNNLKQDHIMDGLSLQEIRSRGVNFHLLGNALADFSGKLLASLSTDRADASQETGKAHQASHRADRTPAAR
jgi:hypothetical protein